MAEQIDALVAAAIHDAKNALMALDTQLGEIERRPASADFAAARATTSRIAGQLAELLTLYRAQGGQLRLAIDDHDLHDFIDDLLTELGPLPAGITLDVERSAAATLGSWAFDAYLVKLALLDALRNALRQARAHVTLTLQAAPQGGICFEVADDGPGFPAAILGGENAASTQGTGLGLSFARLIAERHATPAGKHGHVALANRPGASFTLTLP
ncbi:MAG: sensor histidine kinase [Rhodocyclaceae bacterium]|nr:sensor histidine kinase [Rhodocyclaceae bacterium]MDZ4214787.1 sensor histidine kinase [Rhodocyclaceae bacterium]